MSNAGREFVSYALKIGAMELLPDGRRLKNGRISPHFFNSGLFNTGERVWKLAEAYAACIANSGERVDVVFGPAYKGIPLVAVTAVALAQNHGMDVGYAFNRKEAKDHGEGGNIVGADLNGKHVLIVDDVMTTGDTKIEAIDLVRSAGGYVRGLAISFDRLERQHERDSDTAVGMFSHKHDLPVYASSSLHDLLAVIRNEPDLSEMRRLIEKYAQRYCIVD